MFPIRRFFMMATIVGLILLPQNAAASFSKGKKAYDEKNWAEAIINLRPLAETGDARALVILGNMYNEGYGVERDIREAFNHYRRAALLFNTDAMVAVASFYQKGYGIPRNPKFASDWYKRAAELGHGTGAFFYALSVYGGSKMTDENDPRGVKPDHKESYKWMRIAERITKDAKLRQTAKVMAGNIAKKLDPADVQTLDQAAKDWTPADPLSFKNLPDVPSTEDQSVSPKSE